MIDRPSQMGYTTCSFCAPLGLKWMRSGLTATEVYIVGSASAFGSRVVPSEEVDHAFGMPAGKLKSRAGIVSVAHASEQEDEGSLGEKACKQLLQETGQPTAKRITHILRLRRFSTENLAFAKIATRWM
jgi:hypothetical protein